MCLIDFLSVILSIFLVQAQANYLSVLLLQYVFLAFVHTFLFFIKSKNKLFSFFVEALRNFQEFHYQNLLYDISLFQ